MRGRHALIGLVLSATSLALVVAMPRLLCSPQGPSEEEEQESPTVQKLRLTERISFSSAAPAGITPEVKCDPNGDIFAEYIESLQAILADAPYGDTFKRMPLHELVPSEKEKISYPIPAISGFPYLVRTDYEVDPHGTLYALMDAFDGPRKKKDRKMLGTLIVRYGDDGTMDSYVKLGRFAEGHVSPLRFAPLPDGTFFVIGTIWGPEGAHPFATMFDRAGTFVKNVVIPGDVSIKEATAPRTPPPKEVSDLGPGGTGSTVQSEGSKRSGPPQKRANKDLASLFAVNDSMLLSAPDGNVYLLRATHPLRIYGISAGGEVVKQFEVQRPAPDLSPVQMDRAGIGSIFIRFDYVATGAPGGTEHSAPLISVIDLSTGHVSAIYRIDPAESDFSAGACASSPYDFLFVGAGKDGKLELLRFAAR
jgi:hypothetical protein